MRHGKSTPHGYHQGGRARGHDPATTKVTWVSMLNMLRPGLLNELDRWNANSYWRWTTSCPGQFPECCRRHTQRY
jgi:hypothetical protein